MAALTRETLTSLLGIPAEAMHSFKTMHNEVHWQLVVHGKPKGMPAFKRQFPIHIYPTPRERAVL